MSSYSQFSIVDNSPGPAQQRGLGVVPDYVQQRFVAADYTKGDLLNRWRQTVEKRTSGLAKGWTIHDQLSRGPSNAFGNGSRDERRHAAEGTYRAQLRDGPSSQPTITTEPVEDAFNEEIGASEDDHATLHADNALQNHEGQSEEATVHCECCRFNKDAELCQWAQLQAIAWGFFGPIFLIVTLVALRLAISEAPLWIRGVKEGRVLWC